jgi:N-acetylglutamate synthase-like GNAT family acetyltransferase
MTEFLLRPATVHDAAAVRRLIREVRINPMGIDWHRFVIAVDGSGSLLGCGQLKPHGGGIVELASIAVDPAHRRRGIARALVERLISSAPRPLYLTCRSSLGPFYEKWGFRRLESPDMPAYFRRLSRLATLLRRAFKDNETLLVMILQ